MYVGTDLVSVERVRRLLEGTRRARRLVFSPAEILYCESRGVRRWGHYASRFAAKEATLKALGTGWRGRLRFDQIAVLPGALGRPVLWLGTALEEALAAAGVPGRAVSLSHDRHYAFATVILCAAGEELRGPLVDPDRLGPTGMARVAGGRS